MKSSLPKVLHPVNGKSMIFHVLDAVEGLTPDIGVVLGASAPEIRRILPEGTRVFFQKRRLGTGHAVMTASPWLKRPSGSVLVLCGDTPLLRRETLRSLCETHRREKNAVTLLTAHIPDAFGYGRILRHPSGRPEAIIEEKDASPAQRAIREINTGVYCFEIPALLRALRQIRPENKKGEYYLTDVVSVLSKDHRRLGAVIMKSPEEAMGVNRRTELAMAERVMQQRILDKLMGDGVTVADPSHTYVEAGVRVGADTVLLPGTFLKGKTRVGRGCRIGPFTYLEDCVIEDGAELRAVFAYQSKIDRGAKLGPYTHLRPGTRVRRNARIGNFVEIKKSDIGEGTKVSHLSYIGDARLESEVNVGAGAITCNYDGFQKHQTRVGRGAFVGSNVNLVAPVRVGRGAIVGAGSTVTENVPADALSLERAPHLIKKGWARLRRIQRQKRGHT